MQVKQLKRRLKIGIISVFITPLLGMALGLGVTWVTSDYFPALVPPKVEEVDESVMVHVGHKPEGLVRESDEIKYEEVITDEIMYYIDGEPVYRVVLQKVEEDD